MVSFMFVVVSGIAQPGTLDVTFGNAGKVITNLNGDDYGSAVTVQPDSKILIGGTSNSNFALIRYNSDGSLDAHFGINGTVFTSFDTANSTSGARVISLQEDGKILLVGATTGNSGRQLAIARYKTNGSLDSSFGVNGKVVSNFSSGWTGTGIAIQSDQKILITAYVTHLGAYINSFALLRYNSTGILDSTFGINGIGEMILDHDIPVYDVGIQSDGKIVVAGFNQFESSQHQVRDSIMLIRYKDNGLRDSSFGDNGIALAYANSPYPAGLQLRVLEDDKIVVSGFSKDGINNSFAILRFNAAGSLDSTFGVDGIRITKLNTSQDNSTDFDNAYCLAIQDDGKIVQGGTTKGSSNIDFALIRYHANGNIDSSFGTNGFVVTPVGTNDDFAFATAIQPDNKIVLGGYSYNGTDNDYSVVRYNYEAIVPIKLLSFNAIVNGKSVLLNWQTASEINNDHFIIERSGSVNNNFKEIAKVTSKGNSNQVQQYTFEDTHSFVGKNYYRLKQVDKDGHIDYSKIVLVNFGDINVKVYPNPASAILSIEGLKQGEKTTLTIHNGNGLIVAKTITDSYSYSWNIRSLPAGTYFLKIKNGENETVQQFVKQ
ncbi:T9SS type A sorting domain-containing protein [Panacibacter ginsenosidivorans]|nr:T9SS type A sorting domain-containing protein [Panacibacter ginsenosidivorans]